MKKPVQVGPMVFDTKANATDFFRSILYRYPVGTVIAEPDHTYLCWLVERHPESAQKVGVGIKRFTTQKVLYGATGFLLVRVDGSSTDFSYKICIDGFKPTPVQEFAEACRVAVNEEIKEAKYRFFMQNRDSSGRVRCAVSGQLITYDECHADHAPPRTFDTLVKTFLAARNLDPVAAITPPADNQWQPRFLDLTLEQEWRAFHRQMAVMRIVARRENIAQAHKSKVKAKDKQLQLEEPR